MKKKKIDEFLYEDDNFIIYQVYYGRPAYEEKFLFLLGVFPR